MVFECINKRKNRSEKWTGRIEYFKNYGTHYEVKIQSRSGILVLLGKTTQGAFACMPDFGAGCFLADPRDLFWNTEQLVRVLGRVDGITVASALNALSDKVCF
jgi:hypothetical protein